MKTDHGKPGGAQSNKSAPRAFCFLARFRGSKRKKGPRERAFGSKPRKSGASARENRSITPADARERAA